MNALARLGGPFGLWGIGGVLTILSYAVVRLWPMAVEALSGDLGPIEWVGLAGSVAILWYYEGVRAFQRAFSPRVIARAGTLSGGAPLLRKVFAPFFCMGLIYATRRRLIISWVTVSGVALLVVGVRMLPQPWRGIVDAGVIVALGWGCLTLIAFALGAAQGRPSKVPTDLPPA
ncbi:MAG: hypothetical protein IPG45_00835 [Deltaproteobacteria bacterium]|nr:hypothetical protein [Deltaproteobacteria bacterium]